MSQSKTPSRGEKNRRPRAARQGGHKRHAVATDDVLHEVFQISGILVLGRKAIGIQFDELDGPLNRGSELSEKGGIALFHGEVAKKR
jgi:hypothetical protein